jgi:hypothetical protein
MTKWTYKTETVEVDGNKVEVRGMTAGERKQFSVASAKAAAKEEGADPAQLPMMVAKFGSVNPKITDEDFDTIPGALLEAVVMKILELSGIKTNEKKDDQPPS